MPHVSLIDYGCHSFTFRLAAHLAKEGLPFRYFANGSLESPNLNSLPVWERNHPELVRTVTCAKPYGKLSLRDRLLGEIEWTKCCIAALNEDRPSAIIGSCLPLTVVGRIQRWAREQEIPFIYWLQDLQGIAIAELLGKRLGSTGRALGALAKALERHTLKRSDHVITIAREHEDLLPYEIRSENRFTTLPNWANIEELPVLPPDNPWSERHGLAQTRNLVYSGTLGFKHDLSVFPALASAFESERDVRIVIVSSGAAADHLSHLASERGLHNLVVLPFQPYQEVPMVLASAAVLIAPLDPSAGSFCIPSKVLSYVCAGRPTVLAIDSSNPAASMIETAGAGFIVSPGDSNAFVNAVKALMANRELSEKCGASARAFAECAFSLNAVVPRFLHVLKQAGVTLQSAPSFAAKLSTADAR